MISIKSLRESVAEIASQIPEIKSSKFVFDDSELANKLSRHKAADNAILMTVCPSYGGFDGVDEDSSGYVTYMMFFVLSKIDNKTTDEEDTVADLQPVAQNFLEKLYDYEKNGCRVFENINHGSVKMDAIVNLSQCCGWMITLEDELYTDFAGKK